MHHVSHSVVLIRIVQIRLLNWFSLELKGFSSYLLS